MATPWAKAIKAQQRAAKASLETATKEADEAEAACKAARQKFEAAQVVFRDACVVRHASQKAADGLLALQRLLKCGDMELIESVLTDAHINTDGPTGWRQDICHRAKYAELGKIRFGHAIVWSQAARRCREAWTALVSQGDLPPLHELLSRLKEA